MLKVFKPCRQPKPLNLKKTGAGGVMLIFAGALWVPCLHLFFSRPASDFYTGQGLSTKGRQLAARHLNLWNEARLREGEIQKMRISNSEWDFMGRTFFVW